MKGQASYSFSILIVKPVVARPRDTKLPHSFYRLFISAAYFCQHRMPVVRQRIGRTSEANVFLFGSFDAFTLSSADLVTFVFSDSTEHFYEDGVYHFKYPCLIRWKVRKSSRNVEYLYTHSCCFELFQFSLDVSFVTTEPVQFLDNKCIALAKYLPFEILISFALGILAGSLVDDDVLFRNSEPVQSFKLTIFILLSGRNTGVPIDPVIHIRFLSVTI